MSGYYESKLAGVRLQRCYQIAPPRVQQYLEAEIQHVLAALKPGDAVLELGCGYGRVVSRLTAVAGRVTGIDTSEESLALARSLFGADPGIEFLHMDAVQLGLLPDVFDAVVCIQNGICAFGVDPASLVREALRVARPGGQVLFSTYSDRFWPDRLAWFEAQAAAGLLGPIDYDASRNGVIACTDGFRAGRLAPHELQSICTRIGVQSTICEVDESSVFCQIIVPE
jgi:SAM-dependent methyltransferase